MRIVTIVVLVWLVIGVLAGAQRGYYGSGDYGCAKVSTIAVTVVAGPLNYVGANPRIHRCNTPTPSK